MKRINQLNKNNFCEFDEKSIDVFAYDNFTEKVIQAVYSALIKLLSEYSVSLCFTKASNGSDSLLYYRKKVDNIEAMINQLYNQEELTQNLLAITKGIKEIICTCNFSKFPKFWRLINSNLRFYTAGFSLIIENPEIYNEIKNSETTLTLDYYPEESEIEEYHEYFSRLYKRNKDNNFHYNINDFFQQELIYTVKLLFERLISNNGGRSND